MKKTLFIIVLFTLIGKSGFSQDMFRFGVGTSLKDSTSFIQTISFDFNRTESVKEKSGKSLLYNKNGIYLTPSSDVNLGEGTTSSENNVTFQFSLGKVFLGELKNENLKQHQFNQGLELSPSFTADKSFKEYLYYGQISYQLNWIGSKFTDSDPEKDYVKKGFLFAISPFVNLGQRTSKSLNANNFYSVAGLILETKYRLLTKDKKDKPIENRVFKLSGDLFAILSENDSIYDNHLAGKLKCSTDKRISKKLFWNISYKIGNDGPIYKDFHALETGLKLKY
ncbi:hypothetical protein GCM10011506_05110 [Marivirga lumbricoides]|uniref:DUF481 domain-containing protein n=1 Tax=Marivirga lumbricoides TaxID=1046115 RepID=A0ABQ1LCQ3_9BACT|nr:hypothetical protein GCM10011506_05110 [Marivirga lumbricoides]